MISWPIRFIETQPLLFEPSTVSEVERREDVRPAVVPRDAQSTEMPGEHDRQDATDEREG